MAATETERDLDWYFNMSDSELGLHSSWDAMVTIAQSGGGGRSLDQCADPMSDKRIEAALKQRDIKKKIDAMTHRHAAVLRLAFEDRIWPPELMVKFSNLTGICFSTPTVVTGAATDSGKEATQDTVLKWLMGAVHRDDAATIASVKAEAQTILEEATSAYEKSANHPSAVQHRRPGKNYRLTQS